MPDTVSWLRAGLPVAVLAILAESDQHGYAIARQVELLNLGDVRVGVLYPVLSRLESSGAVTHHWMDGTNGPGKKVYSITDVGRDQLEAEILHWKMFSQGFISFLSENEDTRR